VGGLVSSNVARIHSLKALNSWCEALGIGSLQASNKSKWSWFFFGLAFFSWEGIKEAEVTFFYPL